MNVSIVITHYKSPEVLKMALNYALAWKKDFEAVEEAKIKASSVKAGNISRAERIALASSAAEKNNPVRQKYAEIIVSDSETIKETFEMMTSYFGGVKYIQSEKNIGFGKCANRGIDAAEGEYIFIMNADTIISSPEELNKLIEYMEENEKAGIVGPKLLNFDETHQRSAFRYYSPMTILFRRTFLGKTSRGKKALDEFVLKDKKNLLNNPTRVDWLMGSAILTKKEHLEKIGGFDENFFMYMEDVDLCRRFWESGLEVVYFPKAKMYHFHGKASRNHSTITSLFNKYTRVHVASAYKYFRKYGLRVPRYGE
ncbi:MAG: glycosyltransferase family 2 protein [Candidatus Spechtbacterales bacterium]